MNKSKDNSGIETRIDQSAFIFDLRSILAPSSSAFSAPQVTTATMNRLGYLSKLCLGSVAVISDKEISKIQELLPSVAENLFLIGSHGGEFRSNTGKYTSAKPTEEIAAMRPEIRTFIEDKKPAYVEDKKLSIAVHFGAIPELSGVIYKKLSHISECLGNRFQVIEGHYCWELKYAAHNKGTALTRLFKRPEFLRRTPYFFGSDPSAEPAFLATKLHGGFPISVGETNANSRAKYFLPDTSVLDEWLRQICANHEIPEISGDIIKLKAKAA